MKLHVVKNREALWKIFTFLEKHFDSFEEWRYFVGMPKDSYDFFFYQDGCQREDRHFIDYKGTFDEPNEYPTLLVSWFSDEEVIFGPTYEKTCKAT